MWVWSGLVLSLGLAALAWWRAGARSRTFYEGEVYGMTPAGHRKYALGFSLAATPFLIELVWPVRVAWWPEALVAMLILSGILYGAGFLRGASGEDE